MKYLLWDFDNTLAYRDGMWSSTIYELLNEHGYKNIKTEDIQFYLKSGFPWQTPEIPHKELFKGKKWWEYMHEYFVKLLNNFEIEDNIANEISKGIREIYLNTSKWHVYDDTIYCLKITKEKGYSNIILSNHVPELEEIVENLGIRNYFAKIYTSANLGYEKPNIKIYEKVLMELNNVDSITMIGDNYIADIQRAKSAGIDAILVRKSNVYSYDRYFTSLNELANFL